MKRTCLTLFAVALVAIAAVTAAASSARAHPTQVTLPTRSSCTPLQLHQVCDRGYECNPLQIRTWPQNYTEPSPEMWASAYDSYQRIFQTLKLYTQHPTESRKRAIKQLFPTFAQNVISIVKIATRTHGRVRWTAKDGSTLTASPPLRPNPETEAKPCYSASDGWITFFSHMTLMLRTSNGTALNGSGDYFVVLYPAQVGRSTRWTIAAYYE